MSEPLRLAFLGVDNPHGAGWRDLFVHFENAAELADRRTRELGTGVAVRTLPLVDEDLEPLLREIADRVLVKSKLVEVVIGLVLLRRLSAVCW